MKGYKAKSLIAFGCLMIVLLIAGCSSRRPNDHLLSAASMQSDLSVLWSAIKEVHPGYGIYTSADSLQKKYEEFRSSLNEPMSEDEFISRTYPFLCALGCGHTQLKHSAGYQPPSEGAAAHLPFKVLVHGQRAWITNRETDKLATGDEIISINDVPAAAIIQNGHSLYCGDGYVESFKELYLSEYDGFEDVCRMYYHWAYPYRISVRTNDGVVKDITLGASDTAQASTAATADKYAGWARTEGTGGLGLYFYKNNNTALLEVRELAYADTVTYEKCFNQVATRNVKNLILDIRHNGGGDLRIAIRLLSYLTDSSFGIVKDLYARLPDPSVNSFTSYFDPALTESFKGSCIAGQNDGTKYHVNIRPAFGQVYGHLPPARTSRFKGKLIVLIDGATFSSAALLASALKAQCDARFVGRETAGTNEGCNGFAMQKLTLPATRVVVQFPWLRVVSMAKSPVHGRGLFPDVEVNYTPQDIVSGNDPDLAKALTLIK